MEEGERKRDSIEHEPDGERERRVEGASDTLMEPDGTGEEGPRELEGATMPCSSPQ